jgi:hypothetical protein
MSLNIFLHFCFKLNRRNGVAREIMHGGQNLLRLGGSTPSQYGRKLAHFFWTPDFLRRNYIRIPGSPNRHTDRIAIPQDNPQLLLIEECVRVRFPIGEADWMGQWRCVVDSINQVGRQYTYEDNLRDQVRMAAARDETREPQQDNL